VVSVIIPNYNHAQFLKKRIDSVLNQTYPDFELIILDDYSTDNSKEVIESYRRNPKISQIVYNTKNSGSTFRQWQKGLELAKGDYIWIAESDDWAEPFMLEKLVAACDEHTAISYCNSLRVWSEDIATTIQQYNFSYLRFSGKDFIREKMLAFNSIDNASMAIFRKDKVEMSWFEEISNMQYCGDWFFWVKLATKGDVVEFPERYNYFRQHNTKVTRKAHRLGLDFIEGAIVLKYIESEISIKIPPKVIRYWSRLWVEMRGGFEKGVRKKSLKKLISFKSLFLYYIPIYILKRKINIKR